ncbi:cell envelope integrity protein TolA [Vibrio parahaemolyticus]|uniref:cell envelope integrity protein TolA n=1 Tax=Vibrio parahaemolyticus TaxID=670 RepID=UPI0004D58223|nr:cell envelope integrity protein TolA [Vibrio parahaemolyticus]KIT50782.1 biopolymer transporter TolR [Vibrio parahaemolyticus EN9701072]EGQ8240595.1 cell envelope integrity protein TolA [Vibrio parahaemolyticus]EGQ8383840.1 cell envelope integrity protein TolA [Vibrio parahaemolyticus]EGQ9125757.1 cell envelope integrity protein TolA [Vibrio parahaemolyticus]EGQ9451438.1 cell envelope integrity protein TolA [Vibrio parahaemolyticus]
MKDHKKKSKDYTKPMVISVGLHAILVAALLWGTDFNMSEPEPTGQMVQAVVIDPKLVQQQAREIRQQREKAAKKEQERLDKLRREAEQLEKNRKAEEEQIRKLKEQQAKDAKAAREAEAARKQKEQERKVEEERVRQEKERAAKLEKERKAKEEAVRKAEQERLAKEAAIAKAEQERVAREKAAKEAEEKAKREREAAQKAEQERIAKEKASKEAAEKARKEKERLERLERERKEQEAALDDIFAGLESEASANQQAQGKFVADEVSRYSSIYIQLIQSRLLKDDYLLGKECRVNIKLIPTGTDMIVSSVNVLSGDSRVCAAAKSAIAQVPSFPMSTDSTVNQRLKDINLTVALQQ